MNKEIEYVTAEQPKPNPDNMFKQLRLIYYVGVVNTLSFIVAVLLFLNKHYILCVLLLLLFVGTLPPSKARYERADQIMRWMKK